MSESRVNLTAVTVMKYLLLIAMAVFLLFQFFDRHVSRAPYEKVEQAVLGAAVLDPMSEGDNQMLRRVYNLDPEDYEGVTLYYPTTSMSVEEILLVKLKDLSQQDAVREAMENRMASQIAVFEGYGPEQTAMLRRGVIEVRGNYLLLVVAEAPETVQQAFIQAL